MALVALKGDILKVRSRVLVWTLKYSQVNIMQSYCKSYKEQNPHLINSLFIFGATLDKKVKSDELTNIPVCHFLQPKIPCLASKFSFGQRYNANFSTKTLLTE